MLNIPADRRMENYNATVVGCAECPECLDCSGVYYCLKAHTHTDSDVTLGCYENGTGGESDGENKLTHFSHRKYSAFEGVGV